MEWTGKPWERQKGESVKAFEAFKIYRDLGDKRTVSAVVKELGKSRSLIDRWKENRDWEERARAYDNELDKKAVAEAVRERKRMIKRHIDAATEITEKAIKAFRAMPICDMTPKDIKEFLKFGIELERLCRADIDEKTNAGGGEPMDDLNGTVTQVCLYFPEKEEGESCPTK